MYKLSVNPCEIKVSRVHLLSSGLKTGTSSITGDFLEQTLHRAGFVEDTKYSTEIYQQIKENGLIGFSYERFDRKWRKGDLVFSLNRDKGVIYCHPDHQQDIINQLNKVEWEKEASYLHKKTWGEDTEYLRLLARPVEYFEY